MGEKFIEWSDNRDPLSLETILTMVSFYWFTNSYGRALWAYRALTRVVGGPLPPMPMSKTKPFGFSAFPVELATVPKSWAEYLFPNLVFYGQQEKVSSGALCGLITAELGNPVLTTSRAAISLLCKNRRHSWVTLRSFWQSLGPTLSHPKTLKMASCCLGKIKLMTVASS